MHLPIRRVLSIGAMIVALGGLTATTANAAPAAPIVDCHTTGQEVLDPAGNYAVAYDSVYDGSTLEGTIWVALFYCSDYQSNFARAEFFPYQANAQDEYVDLTVSVAGSGPKDAHHWLYPDVYSSDGSQDSPASFAPSAPARACVTALGPYRDPYGGFPQVCTEPV